MRLGAQPRELLLDFGALALDSFQTALVILHLLLVSRPLTGKGDGGRGKGKARDHTRAE